MKKFVFAAFVAAIVFGSQDASAARGCDLQSCNSGISVDSGATGGKCEGWYYSCKAGAAKNIDYCNWYLTTSSTCITNYDGWDHHIDGRLFCTTTLGCTLPPQAAREEIHAGNNELAAVFGVPMQTNEYGYFGYVNAVNRSPSTGRTVAAKAKLDACLFYSDVDTIEASFGTTQARWEACTQSTYGCGSTMKNEYCTANSAAVCIDRCDCVYSGASGSDGCQGY